jgi:hypothetical protein
LYMVKMLRGDTATIPILLLKVTESHYGAAS